LTRDRLASHYWTNVLLDSIIYCTMAEQVLATTIVYGGDINALRSLSYICIGEAERPMISRRESLSPAAERCSTLAVKIAATGVEPLDDDDWPMWPSQVADVENGSSDLPTVETRLTSGETRLLSTARELRRFGQIISLPF
jgi:hypothetical protein